ncbi:MAG: T9SS type A sorting domain-containing protein [Saprospiraceae bacterium]|nr:T9SS type A sorting domain-containing protein [Candidatus Brachybacter algidus]
MLNWLLQLIIIIIVSARKSKDGKIFDYLGAVAINNTSSNIKNIHIMTYLPSRIDYYRLKSIDNNEVILASFSETRTIQFNVKGDLTLVNVNNEVVIRGVESVATMIVYDFNGKIVYQKNVNNGYSISLNELPKGALYFTVNESDKANTLKVINL